LSKEDKNIGAQRIGTVDRYRDSIRDNRDVYADGEPVNDVTTHPHLKPLVDVRARSYDMQQEEKCKDIMVHTENGETSPRGYKQPYGGMTDGPMRGSLRRGPYMRHREWFATAHPPSAP